MRKTVANGNFSVDLGITFPKTFDDLRKIKENGKHNEKNCQCACLDHKGGISETDSTENTAGKSTDLGGKQNDGTRVREIIGQLGLA